jgi:hypothetical protein
MRAGVRGMRQLWRDLPAPPGMSTGSLADPNAKRLTTDIITISTGGDPRSRSPGMEGM